MCLYAIIMSWAKAALIHAINPGTKCTKARTISPHVITCGNNAENTVSNYPTCVCKG